MQQDGISAQGNGSLTLAGKVVSVNISPGKGQKKQSTGRCLLREDYGIEGDGHAGTESRQVSLLAQESIEKIRAKGDLAHASRAVHGPRSELARL